MFGVLTKCGLLAAVCLAPGVAHAVDTWADVAPGVRHFHRSTPNQEIDGAVIDLCTPGVDLRVTGSDERGQVVSSFGSSVGAAVAVNGDFFSPSYSTDGPTVHAGAAWGGEDHGYVGLLGVGAHRVELFPHGLTGGVEPWMTEVIGGHPTIVQDGTDIDGSGDPLCSNRHPRTAVGLSADRRQLILLVVDGRFAPGRIGMTCLEVSAMMRELGAANAMNMDGGGSSTMWIAGAGVVNRPSDGRERTVGNHLAVLASGGGDAPLCPTKVPRGVLDSATCDAISGWAQDEDAPDAPIDVHVYVDGPAGSPEGRSFPVTANVPREDLCGAIASCDHGFTMTSPADLADSRPHPVWAYGIDREGIANPLLDGGPKTILCPAPDLRVKRHVIDDGVFTAWHMDRALIAPVDDAMLAEYATGGPLDAPLRLVRGPGRPNVFALMGGVRRHVQNGDSMTWWRFPWEQIEDLATDAEVEAWPEGPPLPLAPFVARGAGPEVYLLDVPIDGLANFPDEGELVGEGGPSGGCSVAVAGGRRAAGAGGLVGLLGLGLVLSRRRRRVGRLSLGLLCAVAACAGTPEDDAGSRSLELGVAPTLVSDFVADGCSTAVVLPLSTQIAEEVSCMDPGALVAFEAGAGIRFEGPQVQPFLAPAARDALLAAVAASGREMEINSAYRTVANQYLLYHWYLQGRCGIPIAASPGTSNHESGRAIDIDDNASWIGTLGGQGWSHTVPGDPVHFDHLGSPDGRGADVLAFQRLWNRNHPEDLIDEDGDYGPATDARLGASPAAGFALGSSCGATGFGAMPGPIAQGVEVESGDTAEVFVELVNTGGATWTPGKTFLGTAAPRDRASDLADASWVGVTRAATVSAETPPGATGRFVFLVHGPAVTADTAYVETFGLVEEGVTWFGPEVSVDVIVVPAGTGGGGPGGPGGPGLDGGGGGCGAAPGRAGGGATWLVGLLVLALASRRARSRA